MFEESSRLRYRRGVGFFINSALPSEYKWSMTSALVDSL